MPDDQLRFQYFLDALGRLPPQAFDQEFGCQPRHVTGGLPNRRQLRVHLPRHGAIVKAHYRQSAWNRYAHFVGYNLDACGHFIVGTKHRSGAFFPVEQPSATLGAGFKGVVSLFAILLQYLQSIFMHPVLEAFEPLRNRDLHRLTEDECDALVTETGEIINHLGTDLPVIGIDRPFGLTLLRQ